VSFQGQCAHCGSFDLMAGQDMYQCLKCGYHTTAEGTTVAPPTPSEMPSWFGRRNIDGDQYDSQES